MAKTTKLVRGIHSWITFQKHQGVQSLSIEGKQALADLSQDKNGDTNLILNADKDKMNAVASSVPYIGISHTTTGTDPNQEKTATISQDLTQFPLSVGGLLTVTKETDNLTINDEKVKEFVNTKISAVEAEIRSKLTYKKSASWSGRKSAEFSVSEGLIGDATLIFIQYKTLF